MRIKAILKELNDLLWENCTITLDTYVSWEDTENYRVTLKWQPKGAAPMEQTFISYCIEEAFEEAIDWASEEIKPLQKARDSLATKARSLSMDDLKRIAESGIIEGWAMPTQKAQD